MLLSLSRPPLYLETVWLLSNCNIGGEERLTLLLTNGPLTRGHPVRGP